jgi:hypothetical protein
MPRMNPRTRRRYSKQADVCQEAGGGLTGSTQHPKANNEPIQACTKRVQFHCVCVCCVELSCVVADVGVAVCPPTMRNPPRAR